MKYESQTVLRVFLKSGPVLDLVLPRQESFNVLDWWKNPNSSSFATGATPDGANYCLQDSEIAALVVLPYQQQQQVQQQVPSPVPSRQPPFGTIQFPGARA